jgi:hypothetical protein
MMNIADYVIGYEEFKARYLVAANNVESATGFWNTYNNDPIGLPVRELMLMHSPKFTKGILITSLELLRILWTITKQQSIFSMQQ